MSYSARKSIGVRMLVALLAIAATLGAGTENANADNTRYAMITLVNPTNLTVGYSFQWGDRQAESFTLAPGESRWHSWTYDYPGQNRSPIPTITVDTNVTAGVWWVKFNLVAYSSPVRGFAEGKEYFFEVRRGALTIVEASS